MQPVTPVETPPAEVPTEINPLLAKCTRREQAFILNLLVDPTGNQTRAYEAAGFKARGDSASANAAKCLGKDRVRAAFDSLRGVVLAREQSNALLSAARVLEELRRLAFFDVADFFDENGDLRPLSKIPPEARACIAGVEVARANFDKTDGKKSNEWLHKIKLTPKTQALELLAKHFVLLTDVVKVENADVNIQKLLAGRKRASEARAHA